MAVMHTLKGHNESSITAAQYIRAQDWPCLTLNLSHALVGGNACGPLDVWLKIRRRTPAVMKAKLRNHTKDFNTAAHSCQCRISRPTTPQASVFTAAKTVQSMIF